MKCFCCGLEIKGHYYSHYFNSADSFQPVCKNCFEDVFWAETLSSPNVVIIEGAAYTITPANSGGFGRRKFTIQKENGELVEDTGLWYNGKVPAHHNAKDNAKFIKL